MPEFDSPLVEENSHFRKLIGNIHDSVTVVDASGTQLWTSAVENRDLGYESDFWVSADLFSLVHPDDLEAISLNYATVVTDFGGSVSGEVRLRTPDGDYRHVGYVARNLLDDPEIGGIVITSRSIEAEVQARVERDERQRHLEEALADQAKFIAQLSHEMRSPLHAIQGLAELLQGSRDVSGSDQKHADSIMREATALRHMLSDLLDISKVGAGQMVLETRAFSPAKVCDGIGSTHRSAAKEKGLELRIVIDRSVPRVVLGDEHRLRQILVNLVSNAIKYTDVGSVELRLSPAGGTTLRFDVVDTGRGIPEDQLGVLFEPYRQIRSEDAHVGTGIGLTITKNLTELMGGEVAVESTEQGSTFTCVIPFQKGRRPSDNEPVGSTAAAGTTNSVEILVVDDSEVNRTLATAQLERLGFRPVVASSGADALELLERRTVDLVLMDWHMPEMDGLETTRKVRAKGDAITQPKIVAMTASVMSGDREQCLAAGMDDYLAKPVSISDLEQMITRWAPTPKERATGSESALDPSALHTLIDELGDADIARSIVLSFLGELKNWRSEMTNGVNTDDLVSARRTAHTVKSTAAMLGAVPLSEACASFEANATTDRTAAELLESVLVHADSAERDLRAQLESWADEPNSVAPDRQEATP